MLNNDEFETLRKINEKKPLSQRKLANDLGFSLGKLNYCLKALKGLIKLNNFKKNNNKLGYAYILTPTGIAQKMELTINYMKRKMQNMMSLKKNTKSLKTQKNN